MTKIADIVHTIADTNGISLMIAIFPNQDAGGGY